MTRVSIIHSIYHYHIVLCLNIGLRLAPVETRSDVLRCHSGPAGRCADVHQSQVSVVVRVGERLQRTSVEARRTDRKQLLSDCGHNARQHALDDVQPTDRRTSVVGHDRVQCQ